MRQSRITIGRLMIVVALAALVMAGIISRRRYCIYMEKAAFCRVLEVKFLEFAEDFDRMINQDRLRMKTSLQMAENLPDNPDDDGQKQALRSVADTFQRSIARNLLASSSTRETLDDYKTLRVAYERAATRPWLKIPTEMPR